MANQEHLDILKQGVEVWNQWRKKHRDIQPDLREANLNHEVGFAEIPFDWDDLDWRELTQADLSQADLSQANLKGAYLSGANLKGVRMSSTILVDVDLSLVRGLDAVTH